MATTKPRKAHNRKPHTRQVTKKTKGGSSTKTIQVRGSHVRSRRSK